MATDRSSNTLAQRIALDGGEDIKKELESLGKAGEIAFAKLAKAAKNTKLDTNLGRSIATLRVRFRDLQDAGARIGRDFRALGKNVDDVGRAFGTVATRVGLFTAAVAGASVALFKFAQSGADTAEQITNQSRALGLTTDAYQDLQAVVRETGGDQGLLESILTKFTLSLDDQGDAATKAAKGTKAAGAATREFGDDIFKTGVKVTSLAKGFTDTERAAKKTKDKVDESGKGLDNLGLKATTAEGRLTEFAERIAAIQDPVKRLNAVADVFGKRLALQVEPVLVQLAQNMKEFGNAAGSAVPGLSELEIAAGLRLDGALDKLGTTLIRTQQHIAALFSDPVATGANRFNDLIVANRERLQAFISDIINKAIPVIEDLINAVTGNDVAVQNPAILQLRNDIVQFGRDLRDVYENVVKPVFRGIRVAADGVAAAINFFGGNTTGGQVLIVAGLAQITGAFKLLWATLRVGWSAVGTLLSLIRGIGPALRLAAAAWPVLIAGAETLAGVLVGLISWPALLVAALAAAVVAIIIYWDDIKAAGIAAWEAIKEGASNVAEGLTEDWQHFTESFDALVWQPLKGLAADAWEGIVATAQGIPARIVAAFSALASALGEVWDNPIQSLKNAFDGLVDFVAGIVGRIKDLISDALAALRKLRSEQRAGSAGSSSAETSGFAGGGPIIGPGGPTEDRVPIWASSGEFMQRAAAVRKYGLAFMHAINRGLISARSVQALMRGRIAGLAKGGPIRLDAAFAMPRFAAGGLVPAMAGPLSAGVSGRPLSITIDGHTFAGLIAPPNVAAEIERYSLRKQVVQAGKKPYWKG